MILIVYYKYFFSCIYLVKVKNDDSLGNENDTYFGMKGVCKYMDCDTSFYCHDMYHYIETTKQCYNTNLAIATIYFFVAICTTLLQRKRLLYTTNHIHCNIDVLSQPSTKELQYHVSIATPSKLLATQIKSCQ